MILRSVRYLGEELIEGMRFGYKYHVCVGGSSDPETLRASLEKLLSAGPPQEASWQLMEVKRCWYFKYNRSKEYKELSVWYDPVTLEIRDKVRTWCSGSGNPPKWIEFVTEHAKHLDELY